MMGDRVTALYRQRKQGSVADNGMLQCMDTLVLVVSFITDVKDPHKMLPWYAYRSSVLAN